MGKVPITDVLFLLIVQAATQLRVNIGNRVGNKTMFWRSYV